MWASTASAAPTDGPTHRTLLYYALPGLVTAIPIIPVFTPVPGFYAEYLGLDAPTAAPVAVSALAVI